MKNEIKKLLEEWPDIDSKMRKLLKDIDEYTDWALFPDSTKATVITDMPHGSGIGDPTQELAISTIENIDKIRADVALYIENARCEWDRLDKLKKFFDMIIGSKSILNEYEKRVIYLRYYERLSWRQIQKQMHYSERQPYDLHSKAIKKIKKLTKEAGF